VSVADQTALSLAVKDAHVAELQRQLAEATARAEHFEQEKFRIIDMMIDKLHDRDARINHLLDCIGPWQGPLTRIGGR
jgi:hypothetical protein